MNKNEMCVVLFRRRGTYTNPKNKTYLNMMANELAKVLERIGVEDKNIDIKWMYRYVGADKRERMGYYLFLLEGIGFEELFKLYEKNYAKTSPTTGEIIPMHSDDWFTRFLYKVKSIKL